MSVDFTGLADLPDDFDLSHLRAALRLFDGRGLALDIGAHRGIWSRALKRAGFSHVVAFEPTQLAEQIDPGGEHGVEVHRMAVAGGCYTDHGQAGLCVGTENTGQTHIAPGGDVPCVSVDAFMADDERPCDFIKIDVEGAEALVLAGAAGYISKWRPAVMLEENGLCARYGYTPEEIHGAIEAMGYYRAGRWNKDYLYLPT